MSTSQQVEAFLKKYTPQVASQLRAARRLIRRVVPRGFELVYDNYNALAFGFSPTVKASAAVVSIVAYPKWVTLFFLKGADLPDPSGLLQGSGSRVRSIRLSAPRDITTTPVAELIDAALRQAVPPFSDSPKLSTVVKSVSLKQRPRRPSAVTKKPGRKTRRPK
jgi:hypothetical protein